jgi:hypothetical protein
MKTQSITFIAILLALGCLLSPNARAVVPPPDGGYPNFNTSFGDCQHCGRTEFASAE